jgi:hypothetical protein
MDPIKFGSVIFKNLSNEFGNKNITQLPEINKGDGSLYFFLHSICFTFSGILLSSACVNMPSITAFAN